MPSPRLTEDSRKIPALVEPEFVSKRTLQRIAETKGKDVETVLLADADVSAMDPKGDHAFVTTYLPLLGIASVDALCRDILHLTGQIAGLSYHWVERVAEGIRLIVSEMTARGRADRSARAARNLFPVDVQREVSSVALGAGFQRAAKKGELRAKLLAWLEKQAALESAVDDTLSLTFPPHHQPISTNFPTLPSSTSPATTSIPTTSSPLTTRPSPAQNKLHNLNKSTNTHSADNPKSHQSVRARVPTRPATASAFSSSSTVRSTSGSGLQRTQGRGAGMGGQADIVRPGGGTLAEKSGTGSENLDAGSDNSVIHVFTL
jgi:hypothetical protein